MKLRAFRVRKHRNIEDSGEIELLDSLTCIVGKNQSGKTALLRALHKFNPHQPDPYEMRREWPRGQRTTQDKKQIVCEVRFLLEEQEKEDLGKLTEQSMSAKEIIVTKDYGGNFEIHFPGAPDLFPHALHPNEIDRACEALVEPQSDVGADFASAAGECVWGGLFSLAAVELAHLDLVEAVAQEGYRRILVEVARHDDQQLERGVVSYQVATPLTEPVATSTEYLEVVLTGARQCRLPEVYLRRLAESRII